MLTLTLCPNGAHRTIELVCLADRLRLIIGNVQLVTKHCNLGYSTRRGQSDIVEPLAGRISVSFDFAIPLAGDQ
jgi:hypothetical protein